MITKIEELIERIRVWDYEAYCDLEYYLMQFSIEVADKKHKVELSRSNMEFKKAEYQILNREKYNSDRTSSSHFKIDNAEKVNKLEIMEAEVDLLQAKLKAYTRFADFYKSDEIRSLAIAKRIK